MTDLWKTVQISFWPSRREVALSWLALGLLLAAWNAADNDVETHVGQRDSPRGIDANNSYDGHLPVTSRRHSGGAAFGNLDNS